MSQKDEVDDAIAALNPRVRRDSNDSLSFKDGAGVHEGGSHRRNDSGSLINPIAVDFIGSADRGNEQYSNRGDAGAFLDDEEKEQEEARKREEEKKKQSESPYKEFYRDTAGGYYDPQKKFGLIQDNSLIYDNVTTSYPLNLPTDYYSKYIFGTLPTKDSGKKWFIRPHHLETLTSHPQSVKDDVLNTRYYSHYNQ